jgi:hypothetical protein
MADEVITYADRDVLGGAGDGSSWANAYSSLSVMEAAEQADLVTADEWIHCYYRASSGTAETAQLTINTWITNTDCYLLIEAADSDKAVKTGWDTNRARMDVASNYAIRIFIGDVYLLGLQIRASTGGSADCIYIGTDMSYLRLEKCYMDAYRFGLYCARATATGFNIDINRNIIVGLAGGTQDGINIVVSTGTINIENNIVMGFDSQGVQTGGGSGNIYNNVVFDNADDFASTLTINYNASDDGDGTNAISPSGSDWDNEFNDPSNGDFTLLNTGNCYHGGGGSPPSGLYTTDIEGDTYNVGAYSVGVDEYVVVGGTPPFGGIYGKALSGSLGGRSV